MHTGPIALALLGTALLMPALGAQQLSLGDALRRADQAAYGNRAAAAQSTAQEAQRLATMRGVLPSVRVEGGYVRTTDPLQAFGLALRQRAIGPANFDPSRLNAPAPIGNYGAGLVIEQPLFNADAFLGRSAATKAAGASRASEQWVRTSTRVDVIRAYYGSVLADEQVRALEIAARSAAEHVRQADAMVRNGLVTKSDALLAAVKAGEVDAQLIAARGDAATARQQLEVVLGGPIEASIGLPDALPSSERIRALASEDTLDAGMERRADVDAARLTLEAARADVQRAKSLYLPRLNAFARYDWNSPARLYGGEKSWSVGVMASWSPFSGASELAEARSAAGREAAARAMSDGAEARSRLEVARARNALAVALAQMDIAEHAAAQSAEAHRLVSRRYAAGMAGVVELLDAAATDTRSALGLSNARYAVITALAESRRATGRDPGALAALDNANTNTASDARTREE